MAIELTKSQRESVEYDSGDLLVKGVPGSGKSVVLMERALRFNKKAIEAKETKKILILAFTNSLVKYTEDLVDLTGLKPRMIEISTIDKLCLALYRKMTGKSFVYMIKNDTEREELVDKAVQKHLDKTKKKHRFHDIAADFLAEEFLWIKQKNITTEAEYVGAERTGRGGKVRMSREDKAVAYAMFTEYCTLLSTAHKNDWEDIYTYLIKNAGRIPDADKYDYVLVDEAQDLSYAKLKVAKLLTKRTITIAADKAQKIYSTTFSWKEIGIDIRGKASKSLEKTFRSTKQIIQLAESLLEVNRAQQDDQSEYTDPVLPTREGNLPQVISCKTAFDEQDIVIGLVKKHIKAKNVVGILYRSYSEYITLKKWLMNASIVPEEISKKTEWSLNTPGAKLSTLHSSKGLEFDVIIIPKFTDANLPLSAMLDGADQEQLEEIKAQERSLLYVGMTRAKYDLYLTFSGKPSSYLYDFEPDYYKYISNDGTLLPKPKRLFVPKPKENAPAARPAQPTIFDKKPVDNSPKKVRNGSTVYAHKVGETQERKFVINTHHFPIQVALLDHYVGDTVTMLKDSYVIDKIM